MRTKFINVSKFKININSRELLKEITVENGPAFNQLFKEYIDPQIKDLQNKMVQEFESHPVTREIDAGPTASNSSGTLGGYGNLFAFIGFDSSDNPTEAIKKLLSREVKTTIRRRNDQGAFQIEIQMALPEEIYKSTPMPWLSGKSWAKGIEMGISGLGRFLYSSEGFDNSRSDYGVQSTQRTSGVRFKNTAYISKLYANFNKSLSQIK